MMKILQAVAMCLLLVLLSVSCSFEKKPTTAEVIADLAKKSQQVDSYIVDTKTSTNMKGNNITITGKTYWKKPAMMRVSTDMMDGSKQEVYHADGVIWTYYPIMKMAMKMDTSKMGNGSAGSGFGKTQGPASMLESFSKDGAPFLVEKKNVDGNEVYVFQMQPAPEATTPQNKMSMAPHSLEIMFFADTGLPYKTVMHEKDGSLLMENTYTNYQINVSIPDSDFQFVPPEGTKVMDMGDRTTMDMMKKMKEHAAKANP